jgi:hypothetical protein
MSEATIVLLVLLLFASIPLTILALAMTADDLVKIIKALKEKK